MANLRIAELDFDEIKQNLKNYLNSQSEFTDFDFEGSGLSVLLDVLAYNTHYNAYLANMVVNEMFLDSAVKRSSAVSIAKHLGYVPRSARGSVASVDITVNNPVDLPASLSLPKYTQFTSSLGGQSYNFFNITPYTIFASDEGYNFTDVIIREGNYFEHSFTVVNADPSEKFIIPNQNVDTSTITVTVQESSTDLTITSYTLSTSILNLDSNSTAYFLEENSREFYEIYFGDGIVGKKLSPGNIVRIQYLVTNGSITNASSVAAQTFTTATPIGGSTDILITTVSNATGGSEKENIDAIKFNAPRAQTQNRIVTKSDYEHTILSNYAEIESVSVWGGEDNDPPVYGKVYISLKPYSGFTVTDVLKDDIVNNHLKSKSVLTVAPLFIDPDYIYLNIDAQVKYNPNQTSLTSSQISDSVRAAIQNFASNNLQKFEKNFYNTKLDDEILALDASILSVNKKLRLQKRLEPILNQNNSYIGDDRLKFSNPVHPGEMFSTRFTTVVNGVNYVAYIVDEPDEMPPNANGTGTLKLYSTDGTPVSLGDVGTVNYATGDVEITNLFVTGYPSAVSGQFNIQLTATLGLYSSDVTIQRNQVIVIDDSTESLSAGRLAGVTLNISAV